MSGTAKALSRAALMLSQRQYVSIPQVFHTRTTPIRLQQTRRFSSSPFTYVPKDADEPRDIDLKDIGDLPEYSVENFTDAEKSMYELMSSEERAVFDAENKRFVEVWNDPAVRQEQIDLVEQSAALIDRESRMRFEDVRERNRGFWAEEEEDEFSNAEDGDDTYNDDEITSMAHAELELHREIREYARIAAWDMPLLSNLTKPFELPKENQILRFRYTSYMGEQHPAEHKVVVELSSKDLVPKHLTEAQRQTFLKLVGPRYNPDTDIVRMSCEKFSARAQNKRYLGDTIKNLIKEAKEGDSFADVPLDLRHHKPKVRYTFPESWKMTDNRKHQLLTDRELRLQSEQERNTVVDGKESVLHAIRTLPALSQHPQLRAADEKGAVKETVARGKVGARPRR
ncbi:37S ribosomal protein Rsm24, putative [Talaromyces stipitatus ATCC 10500]|uniref:37S ribosomal protein Rsm24, putative n=1 Tax=Talaromyces stipitatus (strain ATCC 10500 / CBS 375.48 / QM 6759 / NRRL 1006) TaxID=441959 RepID=B8M9F3_TALSN|nr:37S ribosomal protein Rsm24, putative [Talaromyces stipitatus ATCC 10500]EED17713.1 37S ribosomal protein Rsm24, putative [Talaromyces stipitatus ATCC 10500]